MMQTFGVIGGIGSGKTAVSELFHRLGVPVISADRIGHNVLDLPQVLATSRFRWKGSVFLPNGKIDRKKVADIVFTHPAELTFWNNLTHPLIADEVNRQLKQTQQSGAELCLIDAPLLLESGWDAITDKIIFVDVPFEVRLQRAVSRGWKEHELRRREAVQFPLEQKRSRADYIIDNSGVFSATQEQVQHLLNKIGAIIDGNAND
ncbi:MAG: dephospho-CoA kinase [Planctomycetaceae bacterium]|jgi:dephospho-CoA kinase|nr:dephospho-CoA kinase [Planctomycetaceae bacterium]